VTVNRRWVWLGTIAAVAVGAAALFWLRRQPVGESESAALVDQPLQIASAPFGPWLRFEPGRSHREMFERLYVDLMLGHQVFKVLPRGVSPQRARMLLLDDDDVLFSTGRRLWGKEVLAQPGLAGNFCYLHSQVCWKRLFETYFVIDGQPAIIYDNLLSIERYPSRTLTRYALGTVQIDEHKFVTYDDQAMCSYDILSRDGRAHTVAMYVTSQNLPMPNGSASAAYPLLGSGQYHGVPLYVYLDAPGFEAVDSYPIHLRRIFQTPPDGKPHRVNVAVSFENAKRTNTPALPSDAVERHVADYQRWFFENVPYFDCPDPGFKRMWYYRWWIVRFSMAEPATADLRDHVFFEGRLGFDNLISFAAPAQMKELTYLRDPRFGLDQAGNSFRNVSAIGALVDAPSSPYWGEMYSQWTAAATADFHRVHPIDPATLETLLPAMAADVRAWLSAFDNDHDFLPERDIPRITGYDLDILSWWYFEGLKVNLDAKPTNLERVDFASFVYANAAAVAELARSVGDAALAQEFATLAGNIQAAVLKHLWDPTTAFFYAQRASDDARIPIREIHGFFPVTMRLVPDGSPAVGVLRHFIDPNEFWSRFPPVITSLAHYKQWNWEMDGLTRNIAPHPISMGSLTLIRALHDYRQDIVTPEHLMTQLARYTQLMYPGVHPNDPTWRPNAFEYYSKWEPGAAQSLPKPSDISHDFHSMYGALIIEGVIGLTPRGDDKIELRPAAFEWPYFVLDRLRYRGHDLTILWDQPDGRVHYEGFPEGFSLYIDGALAFTRPALEWLVYDPAARSVAPVS
jgi:hypothetical protein